MGAEFLTLLFFNLFISEPAHALQDVLETNFGFQVTSLAGMSVENKDEEKEAEDEKKESSADSESTKEDAQPEGEFSAMQAAQKAKDALI